MHAHVRFRSAWRAFTAPVAVALALVLVGLPPASAADPRLQRAQQQRAEVEQRLAAVQARVDELQAQTAAAEARLAELTAAEQAQRQRAEHATGMLALRLRQSYKRGTTDPGFALFSSSSPQEAAEQARLLGLLALRSRAEYETASAARIRTAVTAGEVARAAEALNARKAELEAARAEVREVLAAAQAKEQQVRRTLAAEEQARQRAAAAAAAAARARSARARPSRGQTATAANPDGATIAGGVACPVGSPRSYTNSWGAPRSGGRRHKGTDILAPRGTGIYAYETGTISRTNSNRLGGISLYLRGASGTLYYYTHLQGYAGGISAGARVGVGQLIGYNGDTGNARGTPHLHFEVMPGGGGNVNPYPYVRRACG